MATIKLSTTKSASRAINYAEKRAIEKNALNCEVSNARHEMRVMRELHNKTDGVQAHLAIQSFSPQESQKLGAKKINELGIELAKRIAPNHQVSVYTHTDKEHTHNHIVINAVNLETGNKYHQHNDVARVRKIHDELLQEQGLEIVQKQALERLSMAEIKLKERGITPWKQKIRHEIDSIMKDTSVSSYNRFREVLEQRGIKIHERGKNVVYELLEGNKRVRGAKLGTDYEKDVIKNELVNRQKQAIKQERKQDLFQKLKERATNGQPENRTNRSNRRPISDRERLAELRYEGESSKQPRLEQRNEPKIERTIPKNSHLGPKL